MKDMLDEIGATRRAVTTGTLPAGEAHVVALTREYPAAPADVWDAITTPERIARWFLPVSGDLRLHGTYQLEGNAGGQIRVCEPPRRLQVTWVLGEPGPEDDSRVEVRLDPTPTGGTLLHLEHVAVVPPAFWDQYGPGAVGVGWDLGLLGLAAHLAGTDPGDPAALEADPAMHEVMRTSARAWGAAHVASGAEPAAAQASAAATTAFYVPSDGA